MESVERGGFVSGRNRVRSKQSRTGVEGPARFALVGAAALVIGGAGCSHSLFKRGVHRSQFETYDTVRNRHEADSYEDEFGRRRINLRGRLLTNE